ncbi:MAG: TetR/AcrR family transcriptional regulator [Ignavibacteria bacterium]|nr:TetR/AcrR family transcriptional regulator [Ignavibacteria bacterium]
MSEKFEKRKSEILKAAQKRFIKHGLYKTSIEEIARDLRIAKSTLYHYFATKEDIYYSCINSEIENYLSSITSMFNDEQLDPETKVRQYLNLKSSMPQSYKLLFRMIMNILNDSSLPVEDEIFQTFLKQETSVLNLALHVNLPGGNERLTSLVKENFAFQSYGFSFIYQLHSSLVEKTIRTTEDAQAIEHMSQQWMEWFMKR